MRVVILDQDPRPDFHVLICFETGKKQMDAPFFSKQEHFEDVTWENLFFPWRSLMSLYDPLQEGKTQKNRYFGLRGGLEEKVERQGKGDQNVWNEHIDAPLSPWVRDIAC